MCVFAHTHKKAGHKGRLKRFGREENQIWITFLSTAVVTVTFKPTFR